MLGVTSVSTDLTSGKGEGKLRAESVCTPQGGGSASGRSTYGGPRNATITIGDKCALIIDETPRDFGDGITSRIAYYASRRTP